MMLLVEVVVERVVFLAELLVQAAMLASRHPRIARVRRVVLGLELLVPRPVLAT